MDRGSNPYTSNAGAPPRYLAGRRAEVDDFRTLLRRFDRFMRRYMTLERVPPA